MRVYIVMSANCSCCMAEEDLGFLTEAEAEEYEATLDKRFTHITWVDVKMK